ncbi:YkgJ family cysteine cluster protein [Rhizobium sp.]|uniref:YkgJ family cysteine cluster protein n=1 Tax=Rhizobium sp. TaxID=391 RepID=UPI00289C7D18
MEHRFACTACGLCCFGILPLTINEAMSKAGTFPLAMSLTPIKAGTRGHNVMSQIGATATLVRKTIYLQVSAVSFIPPAMRCPELGADNLCSIHADKPERCKTMPFFAYKDEDSQRDLLVPRPGWKCDTAETAPVVYRDRVIIDRRNFANERAALVSQKPQLQRYVDFLIKYDPVTSSRLVRSAQSAQPGRVIVSFASFLRHDRSLDILAFARSQSPVLADWAEKTASDASAVSYHGYYKQALSELNRYN